MSKYGSPSFAVLLVDGYSLLAAKVKGVTYKIESLTEPGHGLGDSWEAPVLTGIRRATFTQDQAFFDDTTAGVHDAFKTGAGSSAQAAVRIVGVAPTGNTIGQLFLGLQGAYHQDYSVIATNGQLTKATVTYAVSGQVDQGRILSSHVSKSADWNTKTDGAQLDMLTDSSLVAIPVTSSSVANPTTITTTIAHGLTTGNTIVITGHTGSTATPSLNNRGFAVTVTGTTTFTVTADVTVGGTGGQVVRVTSANGGVGYQLVSALSGITGFVGKIQGSTDDVTYTDLLSFSNVTAAQTAQRVTVAGTIPRYLAFDGAFTGSGTISILVGFARN
jgi:hypothetical protein